MRQSRFLASRPERVRAPWQVNRALAYLPRRKAMPMQFTTAVSASVVASAAVEPSRRKKVGPLRSETREARGPWPRCWLPGANEEPAGIHPADPLISGYFLAIFVSWRAQRGTSLAIGRDFWAATRKPAVPEPA